MLQKKNSFLLEILGSRIGLKNWAQELAYAVLHTQFYNNSGTVLFVSTLSFNYFSFIAIV
jgi:hypothetical protein